LTDDGGFTDEGGFTDGGLLMMVRWWLYDEGGFTDDGERERWCGCGWKGGLEVGWYGRGMIR